MSLADWTAVRLTAELAVQTPALLLPGTPLAWWLARTGSRCKPLAASQVAMPLVLPSSVLGFCLLPFTFAGLVVASALYSLPIVVQPQQQAFEALLAIALREAGYGVWQA